VWLQVGVRASDQNAQTDGDVGFAGYEADQQTVAVGYDFAVSENSFVGISGSYSNIDVDADRTSNDETDIDLGQVAIYGTHRVGALEFSAQGAYVFGDVESERQAFETITGETDIDGFNVQGLASYNIGFGQSAYFAPLVGVQFGSISTDAFTENGGLDLAIGEIDSDYIEGRVGFTLGKKFQSEGTLRDYYIKAAVVNDFGDGTDNVDASFADQALSLQTLDTDDFRVNGQVGYNWITENGLSLGLNVEGDFSGDYTSVGGSGRLKYNF